MSQDKTWPALFGKGGKQLCLPNLKTSSGGGSSSSSSFSAPPADLRARALLSHKKMQEQFATKRSPAAGELSRMAARLVPQEVIGRAVVLAFDFVESLHQRAPSLAEVQAIAEMLRTLRKSAGLLDGNRMDEGSGGEGEKGGGRVTTAGEGAAAAAAAAAAEGVDGVGAKKPKKSKKDKKEEKGKKGKKKEKDKKDKKEKGGKKDKGDKKDMGKKDKEAKDSGSGGVKRVQGLLGGHLEYLEEQNEDGSSLITADTLKLKQIVQDHLKQALPQASGSSSSLERLGPAAEKVHFLAIPAFLLFSPH